MVGHIPSDYEWCPSCRRRRDTRFGDHGPDCEKCGTELVDVPMWRRAISYAGLTVGLCILLAILVGPPAMAVWRLIQGAPLFTFETVTVTRTVPGGVLLSLVPWAGILVLIWMLSFAARGGMPRP